MITIQDWDQIWQAIFMVVGTAAVGLVSLFAKRVSSFVKAKIATVKDDQLRVGLQAAQGEVEHITSLIVSSLNQTVVGALRDTNGKLTPQAAKLVKDRAVNEIRKLISDEAHNVFSHHNIDIENFISHVIERTVADQNRWDRNPSYVSSEPVPTPEPVKKEDPEPTPDPAPAAE